MVHAKETCRISHIEGVCPKITGKSFASGREMPVAQSGIRFWSTRGDLIPEVSTGALCALRATGAEAGTGRAWVC